MDFHARVSCQRQAITGKEPFSHGYGSALLTEDGSSFQVVADRTLRRHSGIAARVLGVSVRIRTEAQL